MTWLGVMVTGPAAAAFLAGAFFAFFADGAPSAACVVPAASPPAQEGELAGWRVSPRVTNVVGAAPAELRPGPASLRVKVLWSCARILVVVVVVLVWRGVVWRGVMRACACVRGEARIVGTPAAPSACSPAVECSAPARMAPHGSES